MLWALETDRLMLTCPGLGWDYSNSPRHSPRKGVLSVMAIYRQLRARTATDEDAASEVRLNVPVIRLISACETLFPV
jgi:hypothetical protein